MSSIFKIFSSRFLSLSLSLSFFRSLYFHFHVEIHLDSTTRFTRALVSSIIIRSMKIKKERKRIQLRREYLLTLALSSLINASQKRERKRGYLKINRTDVLVNTCAEGRKREKERGRARRNGSDSVRSTGSFA